MWCTTGMLLSFTSTLLKAQNSTKTKLSRCDQITEQLVRKTKTATSQISLWSKKNESDIIKSLLVSCTPLIVDVLVQHRYIQKCFSCSIYYILFGVKHQSIVTGDVHILAQTLVILCIILTIDNDVIATPITTSNLSKI